jgi:hypothetical protein
MLETIKLFKGHPMQAKVALPACFVALKALLLVVGIGDPAILSFDQLGLRFMLICYLFPYSIYLTSS